MKDFVKVLNSSLEGDIIVTGGYARYLNGFYSEYDSKFLDIAIPESKIDKVKKYGNYLTINGRTLFPDVIDQFIIRVTRDIIFDVFVKDISKMSYNVVDGIKVQTPQDDISFVKKCSQVLDSEKYNQKILVLEDLYGVVGTSV